MSKMTELARLGQSIWYDFIRRDLMTSGKMQELVVKGLRGMTSNPTIFEKALSSSNEYDERFANLAANGLSGIELYEQLAIEDIRMAAEILQPVYEQTRGADGYVSLEVDPRLANDTERTISEAKRLFSTLNLPNIMIKVPATEAGFPAVKELIASGINVNVTLIFSLEQYRQVAEAFISGLEERISSGEKINCVASVASFFVSRIDTAVDKLLNESGHSALAGKTAIANAKAAYAEYEALINSERWKKLKARGAQTQRLLWASTGTKNKAYSDVLYVDELIGPDTVNTLPPATLEAFEAHGEVQTTITKDVADAVKLLDDIAAAGVDLDAVCEDLLDAGLQAFENSFLQLLNALEVKLADTAAMTFSDQPNAYLARLESDHFADRLWKKDYTLFGDKPDEISNRMGWLDSPQKMAEQVNNLQAWAKDLYSQGFRRALLLGMGGSSLAPDVFEKIFGGENDGLRIRVVDSTDPLFVEQIADQTDFEKTLIIASTKSGGTIETLSLLKYFYRRAEQKLGKNASAHFVAITDPGSKLEELANKQGFVKVFLNDPNIGGRFSALSYFGLVPAALCGVDVRRLVDSAQKMAAFSQNSTIENGALRLGAWIAAHASNGRDKLTFILEESIRPFADWVEQLIAESTGKKGKGILPVIEHSIPEVHECGDDRLFVHMLINHDQARTEALNTLAAAGHPLLTIKMNDIFDLGAEFFKWEVATAVAGYFLEINPYDQPNVESAKVLAREKMAEFMKSGKLEQPPAVIDNPMVTVFGNTPRGSIKEVYTGFLAEALEQNKSPYIVIQAFVTPGEMNEEALLKLQTALRNTFKVAVTFGFGPRFLHSTGQLHKGDGGNGVFIQITEERQSHIAVPAEFGSTTDAFEFGTLIDAQALGDFDALQQAGRKVIRFHFKADTATHVQHLVNMLK